MERAGELEAACCVFGMALGFLSAGPEGPLRGRVRQALIPTRSRRRQIRILTPTPNFSNASGLLSNEICIFYLTRTRMCL